MSEPDTRDLLSAYMDDELGVEDRARVESALAADPSLQAELDAIRSVDALFRDASATTPAPAELSDRVRSALADTDSQQQGEQAPTGQESGGNVTTLMGRRPRWRLMTPLAAAAGLLVALGLAWQFSGDSPTRIQLADAPELATSMRMESAMSDSAISDSAADFSHEEGEIMTLGAVPPPAPAQASPPMEAHDAPGAFADEGRMALKAAPSPVAEESMTMALPAPDSAPMLLRSEVAPEIRVVGEFAYRMNEGRWTPEEYTGEPLTLLNRDDARWRALTTEEPLSAMRLWVEPIVVSIEGEWFEIAPIPPVSDSIDPRPLE